MASLDGWRQMEQVDFLCLHEKITNVIEEIMPVLN